MREDAALATRSWLPDNKGEPVKPVVGYIAKIVDGPATPSDRVKTDVLYNLFCKNPLKTATLVYGFGGFSAIRSSYYNLAYAGVDTDPRAAKFNVVPV